MDISNLTAVLPSGGTSAPDFKSSAASSKISVIATTVAPQTTASQAASNARSRALAEVNSQLGETLHNRNLNFEVDRDIGVTVVRVVDASTQEVITQFPAEVVVRIAHALSRHKGTLLTESA